MNWKHNKFAGFDYRGTASLHMVLPVYMYVVFFLTVLDTIFEQTEDYFFWWGWFWQ